MIDSVKNPAGADIDISGINDLWHVAEFLKTVEGDYRVLSKTTGKFVRYSEAVIEVREQACAMQHHINNGTKFAM